MCRALYKKTPEQHLKEGRLILSRKRADWESLNELKDQYKDAGGYELITAPGAGIGAWMRADAVLLKNSQHKQMAWEFFKQYERLTYKDQINKPSLICTRKDALEYVMEKEGFSKKEKHALKELMDHIGMVNIHKCDEDFHEMDGDQRTKDFIRAVREIQDLLPEQTQYEDIQRIVKKYR